MGPPGTLSYLVRNSIHCVFRSMPTILKSHLSALLFTAINGQDISYKYYLNGIEVEYRHYGDDEDAHVVLQCSLESARDPLFDYAKRKFLVPLPAKDFQPDERRFVNPLSVKAFRDAVLRLCEFFCMKPSRYG
ncbi:hypothetical protein FOZ60_007664 [Perkinsus olseni]|uniref:Uncharacterized protein n=1 Tax=Perkinsus olseni TaxID=32597 RepID=A0A7J6NL70_PEROL|nr:hypothetical protein FOZ60_007664 [Perkinsus olseni]